jgi:hypothetical protein
MLKKIIFISLLISLTNSCAQKISKEKMETIIKTAYQQIPKHDKQPMYALQVDKKGCRASILVNGWSVDDYWNKGGYTVTETISPFFIKSGKQTITLKVYPREGVKYIDDLTYVALEIIYVPQKGCDMDKYQLLQIVKLPEDIKDKNLPYFEMTIPFEAKVPWDHSLFYENLQDLRKVPDIEKKLLAEYKKYVSMIENNEQEQYIERMFKNRKYEFETFYVDEKEIKDYLESDIKDVSPLKNKEVQFLDTNYEIVYELNGRVAHLISKLDRESIIRVFYGDIITEGEHKGKKQSEISTGAKLILPKGKTEFENL